MLPTFVNRLEVVNSDIMSNLMLTVTETGVTSIKFLFGAARQIACKLMNLIKVYSSYENVLFLLFLLQFLHNYF